ncbi:MAG: C40 family peptidase [Bdellovibrio bacteriovorus]
MKKWSAGIWQLCAVAIVALSVGGCAGSGKGGLGGQRAEVVSAALSQIGTPYRYGGNQPGQGLDCSGLTYFAHRTAGVQIPRTSREQRQGARPVKPKALRPGDMVFFGSGGVVDHVGLMVDQERFVHASTSKGKVILARFGTPYWNARFVGAGTYLR